LVAIEFAPATYKKITSDHHQDFIFKGAILGRIAKVYQCENLTVYQNPRCGEALRGQGLKSE